MTVNTPPTARSQRKNDPLIGSNIPQVAGTPRAASIGADSSITMPETNVFRPFCQVVVNRIRYKSTMSTGERVLHNRLYQVLSGKETPDSLTIVTFAYDTLAELHEIGEELDESCKNEVIEIIFSLLEAR